MCFSCLHFAWHLYILLNWHLPFNDDHILDHKHPSIYLTSMWFTLLMLWTLLCFSWLLSALMDISLSNEGHYLGHNCPPICRRIMGKRGNTWALKRKYDDNFKLRTESFLIFTNLGFSLGKLNGCNRMVNSVICSLSYISHSVTYHTSDPFHTPLGPMCTPH